VSWTATIVWRSPRPKVFSGRCSLNPRVASALTHSYVSNSDLTSFKFRKYMAGGMRPSAAVCAILRAPQPGHQEQATLGESHVVMTCRDSLMPRAHGCAGGKIVDAADGVTPVHPVAIDLLDAITGEDQQDSGVVNNPDGSCDRAVLGDIIDITPGANTLDIDLERNFLLSGVITDESDQPINGVLVEVFDEQGNGVCCDATSNEAGDWWLIVPGPGSYYAPIGIRRSQGYVPEIWDDIACDDCDPVGAGTSIEVTDSDVGGH